MTGRTTVRVFVADDHPIFREALGRAVGDHRDLELIGIAANGVDALAEISRLEPDVAILDVRMPGLEGQRVASLLREAGASTRVLLLSGHPEEAAVHAAIEAGAAGYLGKSASHDEVCQAALNVARGDIALSAELQDAVFDRNEDRAPVGERQLSEHELHALTLAAEGLTNREIAARLVVSTGTIKSYLQRAYEKLAASDRGSAVAEAMRRGLIS